MITETKIHIVFLQEAVFHQSPSLVFYKRLLSFLKRMTCFQSQMECRECPSRKDCLFFRLSGNFFDQYPGLLVKSDPFERLRFSVNEHWTLTFYWIGSCSRFSVLLESFLDELNSQIAGISFYAEKTESRTLEEKPVILTDPLIILSQDAAENSIIQMLQFYSQNFDLPIPETKVHILEKREVRTQWPVVRLFSRGIIPKGKIILIKGSMVIPEWMVQTGIGRFNYIGGGRLETDDRN